MRIHIFLSLTLGLITALPAQANLLRPTPIGPITFKNWGETIDPDQDCQFLFGQNNLSIAIPGTDHALAIERQQMNAPRLLRDIKGDFSLEVRLVGNYPTSSTTLITQRFPFHGAGLLLWQDQDNYIRLERATIFAGGKQRHYINFEKRANGQFAFDTEERTGKVITRSETIQGVSLRLEQRQGQVLGFYSADGQKWESVGKFKADWTQPTQVGFVAGHNSNQRFSPTFEQLQLRQN
jgi:regulation of enolase protein 1 (concanavalin A-like superfamily)